MKKILTSTLIAGTLLSIVSPVTNAQATPNKASEVKTNINSKKIYNLPKLNNKIIADGLRNGEYIYDSTENTIKSFKLNEKISSVEKKIGSTTKKQFFKQSNSTLMTSFYGKNNSLIIHGYSNKRTSKMEKIHVDGFELNYNNAYSLKTVEKYFGKADFSSKVKTGVLCRGYGKNVKILYNRIHGDWKVDEVIVANNEPIDTDGYEPLPE